MHFSPYQGRTGRKNELMPLGVALLSYSMSVDSEAVANSCSKGEEWASVWASQSMAEHSKQ